MNNPSKNSHERSQKTPEHLTNAERPLLATFLGGVDRSVLYNFPQSLASLPVSKAVEVVPAAAKFDAQPQPQGEPIVAETAPDGGLDAEAIRQRVASTFRMGPDA